MNTTITQRVEMDDIDHSTYVILGSKIPNQATTIFNEGKIDANNLGITDKFNKVKHTMEHFISKTDRLPIFISREGTKSSGYTYSRFNYKYNHADPLKSIPKIARLNITSNHKSNPSDYIYTTGRFGEAPFDISGSASLLLMESGKDLDLKDVARDFKDRNSTGHKQALKHLVECIAYVNVSNQRISSVIQYVKNSHDDIFPSPASNASNAATPDQAARCKRDASDRDETTTAHVTGNKRKASFFHSKIAAAS